MFGIQANELVGAELELDDGRLGGQLEHDAHTTFAENINLPAAELRVFRSDGEKRLNGVECELCDLRVDAVAADLHEASVRHIGTQPGRGSARRLSGSGRG